MAESPEQEFFGWEPRKPGRDPRNRRVHEGYEDVTLAPPYGGEKQQNTLAFFVRLFRAILP